MDAASRRVKTVFWASSLLVLAYIVWLVIRPVGASSTPLDGWGVDAFELSMGALCIMRYFDRSWRSSKSTARLFPVVLGAACISWALGDVTTTVLTLGGGTVSTPSTPDVFFSGFFPLCYLSFVMLIRRGRSGSLAATSIDGLIAGLGMAALSAAFLFQPVLHVAEGSALATATNMAYPVGDLLLLALAVGGLMILPKGRRGFLAIASAAMVANAVGDVFNLLQPDSRMGYVANAAAWPVSLLMLAIATWVQPSSEWVPPINAERAGEKTAGFTIPALGALCSLAVLIAESIKTVERSAVALASATVLVAGLRLVLTVREARARNSSRFRSLIDNAWDLIVVTESELEIAFITPSSLRVLGYLPDELKGTRITELVHPDDREELLQPLSASKVAASEPTAFETRTRHRNGSWRTIAWTAANLLSDPSVGGYVLNGVDVTEARQAAHDLVVARDAALMASKAKSDFLSTMSHEIRTPMNGVIGLTELLLETELTREQGELTTGIKTSADNLLVIINDILDFSKIEAGKLELEESPCDVSEVADDVGRILAKAADDKGLELLIDVDPELPPSLLGDPVRMQQVLLNLGSNAVKFTSEGEVIIRVRTLHESHERVALRFEVIDQGIGIAESDQQRLFSAFTQADSSTTRRFGGTGLGLTISRQLVDLMGGTLGLISAPGEGSTFWFEVSLRRSDAPMPAPTDQVGTLIGRRGLVVDDNATNRRIISHHLLSWGIEAVEAADAYEALERVARASAAGEMFDLAVLDLNMPGMDGLELARVLKSEPVTASIALFLLSSSAKRLGAAESHLRGFAGSMTKPVRSSELFDCLVTGFEPTIAAAADADASSVVTLEAAEGHGVILLVEDNKVNQLVGSKVLAKLGYTFDIANHGGEALEAVRTKTYDAILMDCQMPEMDGYEATGAIRRLEGTDRHTPIIAMTAAAMDGDRDVCLQAGMDDYITKPIRLEIIASALVRWIPSGQSNDGPTSAAAPGGDRVRDEPLDRSQLDLLLSLDDAEGAVLGEIVTQYLEQSVEGREEIIRNVRDGNGSALERSAHSLKGASANVGANELASVCAEMEQCGRHAEIDRAAELIDRFDAELDRVTHALSQLVGA